VAGAVGAICVVFATKAARAAAPAGDPDAYKVYIAPRIFGVAPIINVLLSMVWHPTKDHPFQFHVEMPGWKLWVGIVLVGIGSAMVLFSKEEAESKHASGNRPSPAATAMAEKQP
jgi:hypothetical protein